MKLTIKRQLLLLLPLTGMFFHSCKSDDPIIPNEEELITTVHLTLISDSNKDTAHFVFTDLDGDGGNEPVITVDSLIPNTMYKGVLEIKNEVESPSEDITEEVIEEGTEHQLFYIFSAKNSTVRIEDMDANGDPLGVEIIWQTGNTSSDKLTLTLRHEPKKPNDGTLEDAGGETDVEVNFDIEIK